MAETKGVVTKADREAVLGLLSKLDRKLFDADGRDANSPMDYSSEFDLDEVAQLIADTRAKAEADGRAQARAEVDAAFRALEVLWAQGKKCCPDCTHKLPAEQPPSGSASETRPCWCHRCRPGHYFGLKCHMIVCPTCGNKRCPRAEWHRFKCTGSNDLNQVGVEEDSRAAAAAPQAETTERGAGLENVVSREVIAGWLCYVDTERNRCIDSGPGDTLVQLCHDGSLYSDGNKTVPAPVVNWLFSERNAENGTDTQSAAAIRASGDLGLGGSPPGSEGDNRRAKSSAEEQGASAGNNEAGGSATLGRRSADDRVDEPAEKPVDHLADAPNWLEIAKRQANDGEHADSELYHRHFTCLAIENLARAVEHIESQLPGIIRAEVAKVTRAAAHRGYLRDDAQNALHALAEAAEAEPGSNG